MPPRCLLTRPLPGFRLRQAPRFDSTGSPWMRKIADGLWQLQGFPRDMFNSYLAGDVLIDAGTRWAKRRILRQLRGRRLRLVALTHCHPDHKGAARAVCRHFGVPLACHEADAPAVEGRAPMLPRNRWIRLAE